MWRIPGCRDGCSAGCVPGFSGGCMTGDVCSDGCRDESQSTNRRNSLNTFIGIANTLYLQIKSTIVYEIR